MSPLTTESIAPVFGEGNPPVWVTPDIALCDQVVPAEANAIIYAYGSVTPWVKTLTGYLVEGRRVAVKGDTAREVIDTYLNS